MLNIDGQPPAKRARTARTPGPNDYIPCPCYECQGALQRRRTVADHRYRYPWPNPPAFPPPLPPSSPASSPRDRSPTLTNCDAPSSPINNSNTSERSGSPLGQHFSPRQSWSPPVRQPAPELPPDDDLARTPSPTPPRRMRRHASPANLPGLNPNDRREHRFNDLLPPREFPDLDVDEDILDLDEDKEDQDEDLFDEFGLPRGPVDHEPPGDQQQPFVLPWADQLNNGDGDDDPDPDPDPDLDIDPAEYCAAFREHPLIRNAYIDAVVQKVLYAASHRAVNHMLKSAQRQLSSNPDVPAEGLAKMALTFRTVERRLGLDCGDIVKTYTLCPLCGHSYSPDEIYNAETDVCQNNNCNEVLYDTRQLASGQQKRISRRTYACASISAWLHRVLNLPGMSEMTQTWKTEGDQELMEPKTVEEQEANLAMNMDTPIGDISQGTDWRSRVAGTERVVNEQTGNVQDICVMNPSIRFSSLPFAFSLTLNSDWFQPTREGNYSVGVCYIALNNLPRHLRFLRENICLALIMPGPKEPDDYTLNQMFKPLIEELLELKQGIILNIRQGEDVAVYQDQVVHAELSQHIADLIARIKIGGGAGLRSEMNFCLYCRARLSSLSVPAGFVREELPYRNPDEDLNNAYYWKSLETPEERKAFFDFTGNRFTALHWLPGWHTSTCSPPDAMHLLYLGAMNWILNKNLVQPGMMSKRTPTDEDPVERFNACLDQMWLPGNYSRLPPKLGLTNTRIKADQWKLATRVVFIPLYMAFRVGNTIPNDCIPRGNKSSKGAKNQSSRARALHRERQKHYTSIGQPDNCPPLNSCFPSRNLQFHYKQVLRFCVATGTIDKRTITPNEIIFGTDLFEIMCIDYTKNNIPLPPNFHMLMHLEASMLKFGSLYNTHVWGFERANGILSAMSHNGRGGGVLEGTLMRGWWGIANLHNLIKMFRALPDRTPQDDLVLDDLISALRGGPEHALQRGTLAAYIAQTKTAFTRLHGIQEPIRLSNQSRKINLGKAEYQGLYRIFLHFCTRQWPDAGIFGNGMAQGQIYLPPKGLIRRYSWVEYNDIRYGSANHKSGCGYSYGYIGQDHHAARIEWILSVDFPDHPELRTVCVLIRRFQFPAIEPDFPWSNWDINLGTASWEFNELGGLEAVAINNLSGTFALFEVPTSQADYWITVSLDSLSPDREDLEDNDGIDIDNIDNIDE